MSLCWGRMFRRPQWRVEFLFATMALLLLPAMPARASDNPLVGKWIGTYQCGAAAPFSVTLEADEGGLVSGEFRFDLGNGRSGAYHVRGRAVGRQFTLVPMDWIERLAGVSAIGLRGEIHANGLSMQGRLNGCSALGKPVFAAKREDAGQHGVANTLARPPLTASRGGPVQGEWEGSISCPRLGELPVRLTMLQHDDAVAALMSVSWSRGSGANRTFEDHQAVLRGSADAAGAVSLSPWVTMTARSPDGATLQLGEGGQSLVGEIAGLPISWKCGAAALRRKGAPDVPELADADQLAGDWSGYDYWGKADPIDGLANRRTAATRLVLATSPDGMFGRYELTAPLIVPPSQQDRYRVTVQTLFELEDGRAVLVPVKDLRAEGRFAAQPGRSPRGYLLAVTSAPDGTVQLDRFENGRRPERAVHVDLHADDPAERAALDAGQAPRVIFPAPIGGKLMAAPSLDAQCEVMTDWAQSLRAAGDLGSMLVSELHKQSAPLFLDDTFQAVYGIPFSLTKQPERRALEQFMTQICARRSNDDLLRRVNDPLISEDAFNNMLSTLMDQRESSGWLDRALSQIGALPDTADSREKLDEIEREGRQRRSELDNSARAKLAEAIEAKRDAVTAALLMDRAKAIPDLPETRETLALLGTLLEDAVQAPLSPADRADIHSAARTKADAIIDPLVKTSLAAAQDAPETLEGLAALTRSARELEQLASALGPRLGSDKVATMAHPIRQRRTQMLEEPTIRDSFAKVMQSVDGGAEPELAAKKAASQYLYSSEFNEEGGLPFFVRTVNDAVQRLQIESVAFADHSTSSVAGEPSAKEMLLAVKAKFDQINEDLSSTFDRCEAGQFQDDPLMAMKCLTILAGGGGERLRMRLTHFEKIGCADATVESGFICDYVLAFQSNSPFMRGEMERLVGAGSGAQGRFVQVAGGWIFAPM